MVVVAILLALWIGIVWWQDRKSLSTSADRQSLELEAAKDPP